MDPLTRKLRYGCDDTIQSRYESLVNNEFCSDVTFIVGPSQQRIHAHKLILVAASEYFYAMFFGSFRESTAKEVVLDDVEPDRFLLIIRYIYTLKLDITIDILPQVFDCAQKYMLHELVTKLSLFLEEYVEKKTALQVFNDYRVYGFERVESKCLRLIRNNPLYFFNQEYFTTIDLATLRLILESERINCTDDQLVNAVDIWEAANRATKTEELRKLVREGKRTYDCDKLHFFGQTLLEYPLDSRIADLSLRLDSDRRLSMYGIGVFIKAKTDVVSVQVAIRLKDWTEISSDVFECQNKCPNFVHIVNLFFEEVVMMPHESYRLAINLSPPNNFAFKEMRVYHDSIKLTIPPVPFQLEGPPAAIAHMYCKEHTKEPQDTGPTNEDE